MRPATKLRWKQDGYLHFAHSPEGNWTIEQMRGRFLLTLTLAGAHRDGADQDMGKFPSLAKAKAGAQRACNAMRKLDL